MEVHLVLKPENAIPQSLTLSPELKQKGAATRQCICGTDIGSTRSVGPNKTPMTAFKSSSVVLYGQHFGQKKSQWPRVYDTQPFNNIEVRGRSDFFGS